MLVSHAEFKKLSHKLNVSSITAGIHRAGACFTCDFPTVFCKETVVAGMMVRQLLWPASSTF